MSDAQLAEIKRGDDAKRVLENDAYKAAFEAVRAGIVNAMTQSAMGDEKTHSRLVLSLQLLNQIDARLRDHMLTGKMAAMQTSGSVADRLRRIA